MAPVSSLDDVLAQELVGAIVPILIGPEAAKAKAAANRTDFLSHADLLAAHYARLASSNRDPLPEERYLLRYFCRVMLALPMGWMDLYAGYTAKAELNVFRQARGYKDGRYAKVWEDGREDNVHLLEVVQATYNDRFRADYTECLANALYTRYIEYNPGADPVAMAMVVTCRCGRRSVIGAGVNRPPRPRVPTKYDLQRLHDRRRLLARMSREDLDMHPRRFHNTYIRPMNELDDQINTMHEEILADIRRRLREPLESEVLAAVRAGTYCPL